MFSCTPYTAAIKDEWDRFALSRGTIFHTIAFRQILLSAFDYQCGYHAVVDGAGRIRALLPLVIGRDLRWKKAGISLPFVNYLDICADSEDVWQFAINSIPEIQKKYRLDYLGLRLKNQDLDSAGWQVNLQHHTFVLPLFDDEEKILALSTASNRNHVRKVYKNNWFAVSFDPHHLDDFYKVYVVRMKQLGSPAPDIRFFKLFFEQLPEHAFLLTVLDRETGKVIGGMLLLLSPGNATVYYPYGATLVEYNRKYINNFMYWEAVRFGIRRGMKHLDLGRSQTGSGTYKYKAQWGAEAKQLKYLVYDGGREVSGPPDKSSVSMFVNLWKVAPKFLTDRLGGQLIKYILP